MRVITEASSDGSRTTVMSSDTTVSVLTPAPMSASAVHVMRAGPPVATEAATALMPSAATTRLTTVASEVAQTGTPSTGAGSPCALRMSSVGLYCSLVVSCHRSCPLFRERPLMPKGRRAAALASADQGLSTSAMLPADTEQRPPEGGSLQSGAVTRIARARIECIRKRSSRLRAPWEARKQPKIPPEYETLTEGEERSYRPSGSSAAC